MDWFKWSMALIGHLGLWCVVFNRIHATAWPRPSRKLSEKIIILIVLLPIVWVVCLIYLQRDSDFSLPSHRLTGQYVFVCLWLGVFFFARWVWRKGNQRVPAAVTQSATEWLNPGSENKSRLLHGAFTRALAWVPLNEALKLTRQRMTFELDVPASLDGLKICQLSDLHLTGHIGIEYFQRVIDEANGFEPDLVVITGDLVDESKCLDWLDDTLGRLESRHGVYYVLGNHDRRIKDESDLRSRLHRLGLIQASGTWHAIEINGAQIRLTGNELPWYQDAQRLPDDDRSSDLRILLSHSPDQIKWATNRNIDLMFAGHTHGGQIALPIIGPIVAPSKFGVLYAAGTFQVGEMLMHVSRGISGDKPVRIGSPPELGLFTIRAKQRSPTS